VRIFFRRWNESHEYLPPKKIWLAIAPTEIDNQLRHRLIQGEVHDEMHLRLAAFPATQDFLARRRILAAFCQMLLNGGVYTHQTNCAAVDDRVVHRSAGNYRIARGRLDGLCRAKAASAGISSGRILLGIRDSQGLRSTSIRTGNFCRAADETA